MEKRKIDNSDHSVESIKDDLNKLKKNAIITIDIIDSGKLLPKEIADGLIQAIEGYQEQEQILKKLGNELDINLGMMLDDIDKTIKEKKRAEALKEIIFDYFLLNSEAEDIRNALKDSKLVLKERCVSFASQLEKFILPYEIVIDAIKSGIHQLPENKFKCIMDDISYEIAISVTGEKLFIDNTIDISKYADGSIPILSIKRKEYEKHSAKTDNISKFTDREVKAKPSAPGAANSGCPEKILRWEGYTGYLLDTTSIKIADVIEKPTLKEIKQLIKQNKDTAIVLWNVANEKLISEKQTGKMTRLYSSDAIKLLRDSGLIVEISIISDATITGKYITLSSKGWGCFAKPEIKNFFASQDTPLLIPNELSISNDAWTTLFTVRASMIHDYCNKVGLNYVMWKSDVSDMVFAKPVGQSNITIFAGLFRKHDEEVDLKEIANTLDYLGGDNAIALIIVNRYEDIKILARELKILGPYEKAKIMFSAVNKDYSIYDLVGKPGQLIENIINNDNKADNTYLSETLNPEQEMKKNSDLKILTVLNSIKTNAANASRFKKDIKELSKFYREIFVILPLLTNLGVLEYEQIFYFGVYYDCFDDCENCKVLVREAIKLLCSKGLLAEYQYEHDGKVLNVYGLGEYCYKSMKKKEVISMPFWSLTFGKRNISCSENIELNKVKDMVSANAVLLSYLKAAKKQYKGTKYKSIKRSVKWADGYYSVDSFWDNEKFSCCLFVKNMNMQTVQKDNIILQHEHIKDIPKYSGQFLKIFIIEDEKIYVFEDAGGKGSNETFPSVIDTLVKTNKSDFIPNVTGNHTNIEVQEDIHFKKSDDNDSYITMNPRNGNGQLGKAEEQQNNGKTKIIAAEHDDSFFVENHINMPSDEDFCLKVRTILSSPAVDEKELFSSISNALLLSRTASFIKGYRCSNILSCQLQFATGVFFDGYSYLSNDLASVFDDTRPENQTITLAAYCFALLTPAEIYDYTLFSRSKAYFDDFERYFPEYPDFKYFFSKLLSIHDLSPTGFTPAAVSLLGNDDESKNYMNKLKADAKGYLIYAAPKVRMKALSAMYMKCFGLGSDLYECMSIIAENRLEDLEYVKAVLEEYCSIKNRTLGLDDSKIDNKLNAKWNEAKPNNTFKLEHDARMHAFRQFRVRLELMLTWYEHHSTQTSKDDNLVKLKVLREDILNCIVDLEKENSWLSSYCSNVISFMLKRIKMILNGQRNDMGLFAGLLYTGIISMGVNGLPILNEALTDVRYNEPWRSALRHVEAEELVITDIKDEILGDRRGNKLGLFDNLHQLKMLGLWLGSKDKDFEVSEQQIKDAKESAKLKTEKFLETLELAYTYNQINETERETLADIVKENEDDFVEIGDFACWRRFLQGLEYQIKEYARDRQDRLRFELNIRKDKAPESTLLAAASRLLEKDRNFAVTEEYINRFDNGEMELTEELEAILYEMDYFNIFISSEVFDPLYEICKKGSGRALKNFGWPYLEKRLPREWTVRQRKDSEELVSSWPVSKKTTTPSAIQKLFTCLGFDIRNTVRVNGYKEQVFRLTVIPTARSKADYLHPIAAFGTQMKSPINVIVLYGNFTSKQLVDTVTSLDFGGISIVLIDRPIEISGRRQIGEIFHTQTSGQNSFLLIDQVLLLYLAMHQITERLPVLLKCTLPYSSYQPFVQDSGSIADEMFYGRTKELARIIDPNGACIVFGGRQLGKTALLQRAENRCMNFENKSYAVYVSILRLDTEIKVVEALSSAICKKIGNVIQITPCETISALCYQLEQHFLSGAVERMHLLIDEVDDFLAAIAPDRYIPIQPFVDLRRETTNNFKFVLAGLHNVCRAKNATTENGIFGQLGTPLCIKPLSPADALQLLSRPLHYLGFRIDRYPYLETILTNTNYYPGILQFFGYMLVETLNNQYSKYYSAVNGNPPFTLQDDQLGAVMNSADLNRSIKDKFRWSLELDKRYFMIARCITMLYHYYEDNRHLSSWHGFSIDQIMEMAKDYNIHCLGRETPGDYAVLLDEMVDMGILSKPGDNQHYRLRRSSFVDIIGENFDVLDSDIVSNNEEV